MCIGRDKGVYTVYMCGTPSIMPREDGLKLHHALGACLLDTAKEGGVQVAFVLGVSVAPRHDTGVDTLFAHLLVLAV